jgi:hypothetical protein
VMAEDVATIRANLAGDLEGVHVGGEAGSRVGWSSLEQETDDLGVVERWPSSRR